MHGIVKHRVFSLFTVLFLFMTVKLKEVIRENDTLHMVFENLECNLYEFMKDRKQFFPEIQIRDLMFQVLQVLVVILNTVSTALECIFPSLQCMLPHESHWLGGSKLPLMPFDSFRTCNRDLITCTNTATFTAT